METILLKILEVQNEILAELRQLRQAVVHGAPFPTTPDPAQPDPTTKPDTPPVAPRVADTPPPQHNAFEPEPASQPAPSPASPPPAPQHQPGGRMTVHELADIGGQFLDPSHMPRGKVKPVEASDLSGSILDDIKAKNKAKRTAFAEFEKFDKFGRNR